MLSVGNFPIFQNLLYLFNHFVDYFIVHLVSLFIGRRHLLNMFVHRWLVNADGDVFVHPVLHLPVDLFNLPFYLFQLSLIVLDFFKTLALLEVFKDFFVLIKGLL